jgi:drug/metabolite transporter (DMT)-like permease
MQEAPPALERARFGATDALLVGMTIIWGLNFVVVKVSLAHIPPFAFMTLRFVIASAFFVLVLARMRRGIGIPRAAFRPVLVVGLVSTALYQPLFINGIALTQASSSALILAGTPAFIALLNTLLGRERLALRGWLGIALSFTGLAIVVQSGGALAFGSNEMLGNALILLCAVLWSLYSVLSAPLLRRYPAISVTAASTLLGTIPLLFIGAPAVLALDWSRVDPASLAGLLFSGLFAIVVAYIIWNIGIKRIGGARTAIYNNLTPVVATVSAAVLLGEEITWLKIAGAVVIFCGLYLARTANVIIEPEA